MDEVILKIPEHYPMTDDELFELCVANKELRIERDENGQLIIMSPAGGITGNINFKLTGIFSQWMEENAHLGYGFDSATGFRLRDKSMRSPDVLLLKRKNGKHSLWKIRKNLLLCALILLLNSDQNQIHWSS